MSASMTFLFMLMLAAHVQAPHTRTKPKHMFLELIDIVNTRNKTRILLTKKSINTALNQDGKSLKFQIAINPWNIRVIMFPIYVTRLWHLKAFGEDYFGVNQVDFKIPLADLRSRLVDFQSYLSITFYQTMAKLICRRNLLPSDTCVYRNDFADLMMLKLVGDAHGRIFCGISMIEIAALMPVGNVSAQRMGSIITKIDRGVLEGLLDHDDLLYFDERNAGQSVRRGFDRRWNATCGSWQLRVASESIRNTIFWRRVSSVVNVGDMTDIGSLQFDRWSLIHVYWNFDWERLRDRITRLTRGRFGLGEILRARNDAANWDLSQKY